MVEQRPFKALAVGSNPTRPTKPLDIRHKSQYSHNMNLTKETVIEQLQNKYIHTKSASDQVMLYLFAVAIGLKNTLPFKKDALSGRYDAEYSYYKINSYGELCSEYARRGEIIEVTDLARILFGQNTIQLNDKYTAEITDDGVKVGCTTIPHERIIELADMIKKTKNK